MARAAHTYRAARRNAGRKDWPQGGAVYEPYKIKADRFSVVPDGNGGFRRVRYERAQPRCYNAKYNGLLRVAA